MRAEATFTVAEFQPASISPEPAITARLPIGVAVMLKEFAGELSGRSATVFTSVFDDTTGVGTYVAVEAFEGSLGERSGAFNFVHSASTSGTDRTAEHLAIVPSSGSGELSAISGTGGITVDDTGVHRIWLSYDLG
ncbi:DUF3224 domain-containing protein [Nocardioides sp. zg-1228]|uniref:DUF3224 domain-containing protein n=1 Tax=Nocardioides sp. zg-1228 TaxID=2763008 RepID=UPI001642F483|nr:DUF3224 domain-containing protein [Nocardioides sp. zg-1228]MBC2933030.1 DUF3224 domain-containing protein [Nocardioides sp. zg-1228]QSF56776.1 DUF3224 domain-containing protein [Nocardioides sp. zg-1228]